MLKEKTKKIKLALSLVIAVVAICAVLFYVFIATKSHKSVNIIKINGININVKIAKTSQEQKTGLCCISSLPEYSGMLFVYQRTGDYRFWMKDTLIPLDIYWIDDEKIINHIEHSVQPDSYPRVLSSSLPSMYVLETNAGFAKRHSIEVGDEIEFSLK